MKDVKIENGERLDDLQFEGLKIIQNPNLYCFTSDAVVLANFIKIRKKEKALEIGSGSGIISILLSKKTACENFTCVEIQKQMAELSQKSILLNDLQDKIKVVNDDVKNLQKHFPKFGFDVVFSNPPYKKQGSATLNQNQSKAIARHEKHLNLVELCESVFNNLKFGGRAFLVYDANRVCELVFELMKKDIHPKRMFFTENGKGKAILVVMECVKGGKPSVEVLPILQTNDKDGNYIQKLNELK